MKFLRLGLAISALALLSSPAWAISDFKQDAPGSEVQVLSNGSSGTAGFTGIADGGDTGTTYATNDCGSGASGLCTQNTFGGTSGAGGAIFFQPVFKAGGSFSGTPAVGAHIDCWMRRSFDGGSTYEKQYTGTSSLPTLARPPDFSINIGNVAVSTGDEFSFTGLVTAPAAEWEGVCQNHTGVTITNGGTLYFRAYKIGQ